jgi:uncharacterized protein
MIIKNEEMLRDIYAQPKGRSLTKVLSSLEEHLINFINHSPFLIMSTVNQDGKLDASPRGGTAGFVKVLDNNRIILPDASGNNRLDSLVNIVERGEVGLLFLIPGVNETLRINGKACINIDQSLFELFESEDKKPISFLDIQVEEVFLHCAKALMRSKLWLSDSQLERSSFPSMGQMLKDQLDDPNPAESQQEMEERYMKVL